MPNRLADETSQYLLQHADNPVHWYAWGDEAFEHAQRDDRPVLLSIGYSSCHWCHVMAHESFEDDHTAHVMNDLFVNVKVDREERPDVDAVYMDAVQALAGHGGWPLTVFLTPDGRPFWGGTYFPREPRDDMPAFVQVLRQVHATYRAERQRVHEIAQQLTEAVRSTAPDRRSTAPDRGSLDAATHVLMSRYDETWGGFEQAPKFPPPMVIELLLRTHARSDPTVMRAVTHTLDRMLWGGVYDQVGGGFHRYSTDERWLVPHFEKMLYDNAQLARVYTIAWRVTGQPRYLRAATETLDYLLREMRVGEGGLAASQDADSEGEEGTFYVFTPAQLREAVSDDDATWLSDIYGVTETGNFEASNVLSLRSEPDGAEWRRLGPLRQRLYEYREQRERPTTDDKVVAAWNGLALAAFAEAAVAMDRADYRDAAVAIGHHLLDVQTRDGLLHRTWSPTGGGAGTLGALAYAEDHASVAHGLLALYEATFDERWLLAARALGEQLVSQFLNAQTGGFFTTSERHGPLVVRPHDLGDHPAPGGNSMAASVLARLHRHFPEAGFHDVATGAVALVTGAFERMPTMLAQAGIALDDLTSTSHELVIVGEPQTHATQELLAVARREWRPHMAVAVAADSQLPLFAGRSGDDSLDDDGTPRAYLCSRSTCSAPVNSPPALATLLRDIDVD